MGEQLPAPVREEVYRQSGGNPFYLQELARVSQRPAQRPFDEAVVGVPASVSAALGQEIEGLGELARQLAWGAAVAGDPADLDLATAAAGLGEEQALAALEELVARDVLRATDGAAPLRVPPSDRAPRGLRGGGRGVAARRARARRRCARGTAERDRGARPPRRTLRARGRRGGGGDPRAGGPSGGRASAGGRCALAVGGAAPVARSTGGQRRAPPRPARPARDRAGGQRAPGGGARRAAADARADPAASSPTCASGSSPPARRVRTRWGATTPHTRACSTRSRSSPTTAAPAEPALQVELAADALYDSDFGAMRRWGEQAAQTAEALGDPGLLAVAQALVCFAEYALGGAAHGRAGARRERRRARRAPRRAARRRGSTCRTTSASPSTSASATRMRRDTSGAASRWRARSVRASSSCR